MRHLPLRRPRAVLRPSWLVICVAASALGVSACRREAPPVPSALGQASAAATTLAPSSAPPSSSVKPKAEPALLAVLPLKPVIKKPFPAGASEEVVCEAIRDTTQKDMWARFGHMIPLYTRGALYVVEVKPEQLKAVSDFIQTKYVHVHRPRIAGCGSDRALLYIRNMVNESKFKGQRFGRRHLSEQMEAKLKVKTLESFQIELERKRLAGYCQAYEGLCDAIVRLDPPNEGDGLCFYALIKIGFAEGDEGYSAARARCSSVAPAELACAIYAQRGSPRKRCIEAIERLVGRKPNSML